MNKIRKTIQIFSYIVLGMGFIGIVLSCCHSDKLDITNYSFKDNKITDDETFKAIVISDYHHRELQFKNTNLLDEIEKFNDLDAIFFTGDIIDSHVKTLDDVDKILTKSCSKANHVYYVTGNHEEYAPLWPNLRDSLLKYPNLTFLDNKYDDETFASKNVVIYGLEDPRFVSHGLKEGDKEYGNSKQTLEKFKIGFNKDKVNILLTHRPELFSLYAEYNFDYVFAGHSHGGQIRIGNWTAWQIGHGKDNYPRGQYKMNNTNLVVSAGLGYSAMFPIRINCNPEIVSVSISK